MTKHINLSLLNYDDLALVYHLLIILSSGIFVVKLFLYLLINQNNVNLKKIMMILLWFIFFLLQSDVGLLFLYWCI